jgi:hypothetical protein
VVPNPRHRPDGEIDNRLGAHGFCFGVIQKGVGPKNLLPWRLATRQTHWLNLAILWELVLLAAIVYVPFFHHRRTLLETVKSLERQEWFGQLV